jgi:segregation and condensation protein B
MSAYGVVTDGRFGILLCSPFQGKKALRLSQVSVAAGVQRAAMRNQSVALAPRQPWRCHTVWRTLGADTDKPAVANHNLDGPEQLRRVEAILLLAREPLSSRKLSKFANLEDATKARTLVRRLNEQYDHRERAFRVEEIAGGFQLLTRPVYGPWLRRLEHVPREMRLSPPAQETLAVVAYRQPTPRAEVEAIRGVSCGEILRQLMERDLVRITGRSEELGRPYLYGTTRRFLQLFGLRSLERLPRVSEMRVEESPSLASNLETTTSQRALDGEMEEDKDVSVTIARPTRNGKESDNNLVQDPQNTDELDDDDEFDDEDEEIGRAHV